MINIRFEFASVTLSLQSKIPARIGQARMQFLSGNDKRLSLTVLRKQSFSTDCTTNSCNVQSISYGHHVMALQTSLASAVTFASESVKVDRANCRIISLCGSKDSRASCFSC